VAAVRAQGERPDPDDGRKIERGVKMREQGAAARPFPFQGPAQPVAVDGGKEQVVLPGEMFRCGLAHLRGRSVTTISGMMKTPSASAFCHSACGTIL